MLREHFFDWKLEQMLVPLTTIAADLVSAEEFVRESGDAVTGILESINLGGISVPICRDGKALVDGGYLNNVPADTLVRQGADFVISVDITKSIKKQFGQNTPETPTEKMKAPRIGQVLARIREVAQKNLSIMGAGHADFVISPEVGHIDYADFKSTPSTAKIGYDAAMKVMPDLLSELNHRDGELFPI
jgi:predicted acylesterase/phospholipase RssA